ncbi:MAG: hypothetical protein ABID61_02330 [Candidatus Micrarchaeota archaeon]
MKIGIFVFLASVVLLLSSVSAAYDPAGWAANLSAEKCKEIGVQAVYTCNGDVVKVVWSDANLGSTFYRPDGAVISCPSVSAPQMGAACLQMFMPNFCPLERTDCGVSEPVVFPGQPDSPQTNASQVNYTPPVQVTPTPVPQPVLNQTVQNITIPKKTVITSPVKKTAEIDESLLLPLVVAGAGIVLLFFLYVMFKGSIGRKK